VLAVFRRDRVSLILYDYDNSFRLNARIHGDRVSLISYGYDKFK